MGAQVGQKSQRTLVPFDLTNAIQYSPFRLNLFQPVMDSVWNCVVELHVVSMRQWASGIPAEANVWVSPF